MRNHKVAIQGSVSSFHDIAAKKFFGESISVLECGSFKEVCSRLSRNEVDYGIIAIENKIAGSILLNYQLVDQFDLKIIGETYLPISLDLLVKPGTVPEQIKEIVSHPMALGQCQNFLNEWEGVKVTEYKDTASSAQLLVERGGNDMAVIAGPAVAKEFGLETLATNIGDSPFNFTRFYLLSKERSVVENPTKASITLTLQQKIGALSDVLVLIKIAGLNMTKIQSVPIPNDPHRYAFYLDLEFASSEAFEQTFEVIANKAERAKILGVYKGEELPIALPETILT